MQQALAQLATVKNGTSKQILDVVNNQTTRLTQSPIGYLAVMDDTEQELTMVGWSNAAMANCKMIDKPIVYALKDTGMWGDAVRERKACITNDYKGLVKPTKKGYPAGHVDIKKHLNIPVFEGGKIVAVAGVGNKATDYTQADVNALTQFMNEAWKVMKEKI